ncbi:2-C-methyl-D-erythritol 4-phosphate cytidylyltransferase [Desulfuromusa kysingii]|uniref:2-C-methyl-D-erythritol 4-phosphate cytidylyltransferase n=1 Tax=Desulfuromusa kysingii TaxID=37625 RepID=A0A1H4ARX2_9BACT|nr:2-C-methyl-D-erythritol 4-phosphate cytidylyltransferase [Desulfuromusa kysingii]SEA38619.1 2-C-methyl-D-erythritol 4-phosphate cytidylyltransferase [Desulfuromusa kysingii]
MKATVLIPAAGTGRRMGGSINKQYLELAGKPVLAHTLTLFENHPQVENIYLIVSSDDISYCQEQIVDRFKFNKVSRIIAGGAERQDSVRNGLKALTEDGFNQPHRPILIHDGARPLFDCKRLSALIEAVEESGACTIGVPVKDTIKDVVNKTITGSPDRSRLWQAQTPQGFQYRLINDAFTQADADGFVATDDASLLERLGHPVQILEGDYRNIKVTTPEDILVAVALLGDDHCSG